jgi:chorismate-pyruvate lyase
MNRGFSSAVTAIRYTLGGERLNAAQPNRTTGMPAGPEGLQVITALWSAFGHTPPAIELLIPEQLPSAFRVLLAHSNGMTSTLERHWRESVHIQLLTDDISLEHRALFRFVVLRTHSNEQSVEIALIRIPLDVFAPALRQRFIEAKQPFGTLLAEAGIRFHARPLAYFTCEANAMLAEHCELSQGTRLYGRVNQLLREDDGALLCETVEALPRA